MVIESALITCLTMLSVTFTEVALRAFQNLNVFHDKWWLIPPCSYGMALCAVLTIRIVAVSEAPTWAIILSCGTGGWLGCFLAMWLHRRFR